VRVREVNERCRKADGWRTRLGYVKVYWVRGKGLGPRSGVDDGAGGAVKVWALTERAAAKRTREDNMA
jgi:hypothetical protein